MLLRSLVFASALAVAPGAGSAQGNAQGNAQGTPPASLAGAGGGAPLVAEGCLGCHGVGGAGVGSVPALAGRDAAELSALMAAFRANERPATIMGRIARGYTEAEVAAAVAHFAARR